MQINKSELDAQLVELLPERETLWFNRFNIDVNFANVTTAQSANAVNVGLVNLGAAAGNESYTILTQVND